MASRNRPSFEKRLKERRRAERKSQKAEKKAHRKLEAEHTRPASPDEDPDIAGIVPGPQPSLFDESGLPKEPADGDEPTDGTDAEDRTEH